MAVDRVDADDTADRRAEPPADASRDRQADGPADKAAARDPGADQERKVIAVHLHRLLVDHTYGVARDAWAAAVPHLRAAWENHVKRYPERNRAAPRTTPD